MSDEDRRERAPAGTAIQYEESEVLYRFRVFMEALRHAKARAGSNAYESYTPFPEYGSTDTLPSEERAVLSILRSERINLEELLNIMIVSINKLHDAETSFSDRDADNSEGYIMSGNNIEDQVLNIRTIMNKVSTELQDLEQDSLDRTKQLQEMKEAAARSIMETEELLGLKIGP